MSRKIRLVWDFYGDTSEGTAEHHVRHLKEFMQRESLSFYNTGTTQHADFHTLAYMTVDEKDVTVLRDSLRPNRAFVEKGQ